VTFLGGIIGGGRRWIDAGRSSIVLALGLALVVPSINVARFDGLPLDSAPEAIALAALVPFLVSASMREALVCGLRRWKRWAPRTLVATGVAVIFTKLGLLAAGSDRGFVGCYSSPWVPAPQRCDRSYENWLRRDDGATRVDAHIDFGPSDESVGELVPDTANVHHTGVAASDWNLSFANDSRFNRTDPVGNARHERLPLKIAWRGTVSVPHDGAVRVQYVGAGVVTIGPTEVQLPRSVRRRTVVARAPPGNEPLEATFFFADPAPVAAKAARLPYGELRLLGGGGQPMAAAPPSGAERVAAGAVDVALVASFLVLVTVLVAALGRSAWLLGGLAMLAGLSTTLSSSAGESAFMALAAVLAVIVVWRPPRRPILWAYAGLLILNGVRLLSDVSDLHAVLYRSPGTDWLTYESFARDLVLGRSLEAGEAVFYYQPGWRYVLGVLHLLLGDGEVLVTIGLMLALSLSFAALISWHRGRGPSARAMAVMAIAGGLLLAVLNSGTVLSLVLQGTSEVPTWALLPLAVAAPQLRIRRPGPWIGSAAAAALTWVVRPNQALGAGVILGAIGMGLGPARRRTLAAAAGVAVTIAALPALHNVAYGDRLILSSTSGGGVNREISFSELPHVFSDGAVRNRLETHVRDILYAPPTEEVKIRASGTPAHFRHLRPLLRALLVLWLAVLIRALLTLRRRSLSVSGWLLLLLPVAYLAPHLIYNVDVYYPRHILIGYLAMGVSAIGAFAEIGTAERTGAPNRELQAVS
jgi:hypothetical protein